MRIIFFLYISTLFYGCNLYPKDYRAIDGIIPQPYSADCTVVFEEIKDKWAIHQSATIQEGACYYYNKKLIEKIIETKECFVGLDSQEIYELFNIPSYISGDNFFYYMCKDCNSSLFSTGEHHLRFTANDTIAKVAYYPIVSDY